jgi:predicted nucleic-acid-binding protein
VRGLDTNLLVRYLTQDDPVQSGIASRLFEEAEAQGEHFHLNVVVLCELAWTLRGNRYRFGRVEIAVALDKLLTTPLFDVDRRDQVLAAIADYRTGRADFADYLIGHLNHAVGCADTVTLDSKLADSDAFTTL